MLQALSLALLALLAACSTPPAEKVRQAETAGQQVPPLAKAAPTAATPSAAATTIDDYKKDFALKIVNGNRQVFDDPLPKMLKSIVVVDVTIDRHGKLSGVTVRRSNGYKELEKIALASVREAAPFDPPARSMGRRDGSVNFLETFLFRDDGRFQVRTLAGVQ